MKYCMLVGLTVCLSISSTVVALADDEPELIAVRVFERSADRLVSGELRNIDGEVHVALKLLTKKLGLELKELGEERIGICRGDLCIPFDVAEKAGALRRDGKSLWVPVTPLVEALGGFFTWDAEAKALLMDLSDVHRAATWAVGTPFDLKLPDLEGNPVSVERYRGRKVLLYAWASW